MRRWLFLGVVAWVLLACDGRLHWDEPAYWYTAAELSVAQILAGDFQPAAIEGFSVSRAGHVLLLKLLTSLVGPGPAALVLIIAVYLAMLVAFLWIAARIVRALDPQARFARASVAAAAFMPVIVYLGFKTLAEIPALFLSALASLAFLQSFSAHAKRWIAFAALSLGLVAFVKNHTVILLGSLVATLLIVPLPGFPRRRVLLHALACGAAALALFIALIWITGISLERYFAVLAVVDQRNAPVAARVLALLLECGTFLLALPLALLSPRRREVAFFTMWFVLATLPLLLLGWVEDRYLAANVVPLAGLIQLAMQALAPRLGRLQAVALGILLIVPTALAQFISLHEIRMDQMQVALRRLDATYHGSYTLLVPREYADFHYLRFVYPQLAVYDVYSPGLVDGAGEGRESKRWAAFQRRYYGERAIQNFTELESLRTPLVYFGIESNLTVRNLRTLARATRIPALQRLTEQAVSSLHPRAYLEGSWMRRDPRIHFGPAERTGPYVAIPVTLSAPKATDRSRAAPAIVAAPRRRTSGYRVRRRTAAGLPAAGRRTCEICTRTGWASCRPAVAKAALPGTGTSPARSTALSCSSPLPARPTRRGRGAEAPACGPYRQAPANAAFPPPVNAAPEPKTACEVSPLIHSKARAPDGLTAGNEADVQKPRFLPPETKARSEKWPVRFRVIHRRQKPRLLPPGTKAKSEKSPQAIFPME